MKKIETGANAIRVGVSSCLLGKKVRWDGGHKKDRYLTNILKSYFILKPVCPEVEVGMGVPRESVRLVGDISSPRMVGNKTGKDWTDQMKLYNKKRMKEIALFDLSGFVLKKDSPSCGMERVKVYGTSGMPIKKGQGIFGGALTDYFKNLPVEEEGRLNDHVLRENFIVRVFAYHSLKMLYKKRFSRGNVVNFHSSYKYLLLSHSPKHYQSLGRLVAQIKKYSPDKFRVKYENLFMDALSIKSTIPKNHNVLLHIFGFLKDKLDPMAKKDILRVVENYHKGLVPLVVPITLIKHYIDLFDIEYIKDQNYLNPHPEELMLRNHV
jgi:uncharacterized protein YbgA (DUF1722 family)/uncharacterized protein YbbK (DUF523 family)